MQWVYNIILDLETTKCVDNQAVVYTVSVIFFNYFRCLNYFSKETS